MFGVILLIAATFVAVIVMGVNLSSKSDEIQKLKAELAKSRKDSGSEVLNIDAMYRVIQEEGYFPTKDSNGEISFKIKGTELRVGEFTGGFVYTRIYYNMDDMVTEFNAANEVNKSVVAVKALVFQEEDLLLFSVESYCHNVQGYREFFQRSIAILRHSLDKFGVEVQKFQEAQNKPSPIIEEKADICVEHKMLS